MYFKSECESDVHVLGPAYRYHLWVPGPWSQVKVVGPASHLRVPSPGSRVPGKWSQVDRSGFRVPGPYFSGIPTL